MQHLLSSSSLRQNIANLTMLDITLAEEQRRNGQMLSSFLMEKANLVKEQLFIIKE